jgi:hypothetical protein
VDVKHSIADYKYPNKTDTGADPFVIQAGVQEMDGETALKYARSRHTTSDYDRAARQQQILAALQQKALSAGVLTNPRTLKKVFDSLTSNMDTNMSWQELLSLAKFGNDFDRSHLVMKGLNEYRDQEGGFLGAGSQELYGGFVLLPYSGSLDEIHQYANLIFHHRELYYQPAKLQILNATRSSGLAGKASAVLTRYGFNVVDIGNYLGPDGEKQYAEETFLLYYSWGEVDEEVVPTYHASIKVLQDVLPFIPLPGNRLDLQEDVDLTLVLGSDYEGLSLNSRGN